MLNMFKRVLLCSTLLICFFVKAQIRLGGNLIIDSSFEYNNILYDADQFSKSDSFDKRSIFWNSPTGGTPDIKSTKYIKGQNLKLPEQYFANYDNLLNLKSMDTILLKPKTGNSVAGIFFMNAQTFSGINYKFYREFIQTKLIDFLKLNNKYKLSFYFIKVTNFGIRDTITPLDYYFSNLKISNKDETNCFARTDCTNFKIQYSPQISFYKLPFTKVINKQKAEWSSKSMVFKTKTSNLIFLTIGHFSDTNYLRKLYPKKNWQNLYYYIDDISLYEIPCIVAPDTVCYGSNTPLTTTLGMPYYFSTKANGSDTLSKDSIYNYLGTKTQMLYAFGKYGKDSLRLVVNKIPKPTWADTTHFCTTPTLTLTAGSPAYFYQWHTGSTSRQISVSQTGLQKVKIRDSFGCADSFTTYALQHPLPNTNFEENYSLCTQINEAISLDAGNQYSCLWQPINSSQCKIIVNTPNNLTLTIKTLYGCTTIKNINVSDYCTPRVFIPNTLRIDGVNNTFAPNIQYAKNIELTIFNRWGQILYKAQGEKVEWNAKYMDSFCPPDMYFYILKVSPVDGSGDKSYKGYLRVF